MKAKGIRGQSLFWQTVLPGFFCLCGCFFALSAQQPEENKAAIESNVAGLSPEQLKQRGFDAYRNEEWQSVVKYLGQAAMYFSDDDLLYLYLGTAHQILGQQDEAEKSLIQGINLQGPNMQKIGFVLGNYYYSQGRYDEAVDAYNLATWGEEQLVQAFLNRANLYLSNGYYANALNDYIYFLFRRPFDTQRKNIEAIIEKLKGLGAESRIQADGGILNDAQPTAQNPLLADARPQKSLSNNGGLSVGTAGSENQFGGGNTTGSGGLSGGTAGSEGVSGSGDTAERRGGLAGRAAGNPGSENQFVGGDTVERRASLAERTGSAGSEGVSGSGDTAERRAGLAGRAGNSGNQGLSGGGDTAERRAGLAGQAGSARSENQFVGGDTAERRASLAERTGSARSENQFVGGDTAERRASLAERAGNSGNQGLSGGGDTAERRAGLAGRAENPGNQGLSGGGNTAERGGVAERTGTAGSEGVSGSGNLPENALANTLPSDARAYQPLPGDDGNTVGSGGSPQAQQAQRTKVQRSLFQLNQSAILFGRERPELIAPPERFSDIDE